MRVLCCVLLLLVTGPGLAQTTTSPITTEASAAQDAEIAVRLRDILGELGNYGDVTVSVNEGIVTLRGTANSALEAADVGSLAGRVEGVVAVKNEVTETTDVARRLDPVMDRFRARVDALLAMLPLLGIALAAFLLVVFVGLRIARAKNPWNRLAPNAFVADIYRQLVRIAFVVIALVIALDILNATALLSTILGAAGIIGLALGFAVRDTVENFIASVMLSFRQPFRPNDAIEINGDEGKVIRLTSRATILLSWDGNHIRIPNATVFKSRIVNFTTNAERRIKFEIGVASDAELEEVRALAEATVAALPFTLDHPPPATWIDRIGDGAIFLVVTGWINQRETSLVRARGEALRKVKAALEAAGVDVPDTTYRIQMLPEDRALSRDPMTAPDAVADVTDVTEADLDEIIAAERDLEDAEDLLRPDALKE